MSAVLGAFSLEPTQCDSWTEPARQPYQSTFPKTSRAHDKASLIRREHCHVSEARLGCGHCGIWPTAWVVRCRSTLEPQLSRYRTRHPRKHQKLMKSRCPLLCLRHEGDRRTEQPRSSHFISVSSISSRSISQRTTSFFISVVKSWRPGFA